MKLKIIDGNGKCIQIECDPKDKLSTIMKNYEAQLKLLNPKGTIRSLSFSFNGDVFTNENNEDLNLEDLLLEDGDQITCSYLYNGGLFKYFN